MDLGLAGRRVLVTGASRGIGRAIATSFAREGARVAIVSRSAEEIARTASDIERDVEGARVVHGAFDVATLQGATGAIAWAERAFSADDGAPSALDVLVNNVGGSAGTGPFDVSPPAAWAVTLDLNLNSAVWCSHAALPAMIKNGGGVIVHITSICGLEYCTSAPYTAAKGALAALTKEMATDLAKHGVRVVAVAPGSTMFEGGSWDKRRKEKPEMVERMLNHDLPFKRFGTPEEIANVVVFVASPRASWVAGTSVVVDGSQMRGV